MENIFNLLDKIFNLIKTKNLEEIEIELKEEDKKFKINLKRNYNPSFTNFPNFQQSITFPSSLSSYQESISHQEYQTKEEYKEYNQNLKESNIQENVDFSGSLVVRAPISGNFYLYPFPGADPFIQEGQQIEKGQIICIIESMKVLNEIESPYNGKVKKILVENSKFVKENDPLVLLE
ncbi:MAG: acetyl-CoA carboxylase biotin carboxyl carrier protein [bacterium]